MNSAVLAILGAIAAIVATIGFWMFGRPSGVTTTGSVQPTERVLGDLPVETKTPPIEDIPVSDAQPMETADAANAEPIVEPIGETPEAISEVAVSGETTTDGLTLDSVTQPETIDLNEAYVYADEQPIELNLDDATQVNDLSGEPEMPQEQPDISQFAEPLTHRAQPVPPMAIASSLSTNNPPIQHAPYSVLNDPKRPQNLAAQKLSQQILTWGQSPNNATQVITYSQDPDPIIRKYVAQSLSLMVKSVGDRTTLPTVIATLEKLSQDSDAGVKAIAQSGLS